MGSPGKALAHERAKCYPDKGVDGHSGEAPESEALESEVRSCNRRRIEEEDR